MTAINSSILTKKLHANEDKLREISELLRKSYTENNGAYAGLVLKYPREVGGELGTPISSGSIDILKQLNSKIEPKISAHWEDPFKPEEDCNSNASGFGLDAASAAHWEDPLKPEEDCSPDAIGFGLGAASAAHWEDPLKPEEECSPDANCFEPSSNALDYYKKLLEEKSLDPEWYIDASKKASKWGIEITEKSEKDIYVLGNEAATALDQMKEPGVEPEAAGVAIVVGIVIVIALGPRGKRADQPEGLHEKFPGLDPQKPFLPPVIDPSWSEKF